MSIKIEPLTGRRVAATIVDYLAIFAFTFWYVMAFGEPNNQGGKTVSGLPALVPMAFWIVWIIIPESLWGKTAGHAINRIRVVSFDGVKPNFGQVLKRRVCDIIEISWCFGLIAFILAKNTQYHQRLGDLWAKTLVIDIDAELAVNQFEFEKGEA